MWNLTVHSELKNKGGIWQFSNAQWALPMVGAEGVIEIKNSSESEIETNKPIVLGIENLTPESGSDVVLEPFDTTKSDLQKWLIGDIDEHGWFTITNSKTGVMLSALEPGKPAKVKGNRLNIFEEDLITKKLIRGNFRDLPKY